MGFGDFCPELGAVCHNLVCKTQPCRTSVPCPQVQVPQGRMVALRIRKKTPQALCSHADCWLSGKSVSTRMIVMPGGLLLSLCSTCDAASLRRLRHS